EDEAFGDGDPLAIGQRAVAPVELGEPRRLRGRIGRVLPHRGAGLGVEGVDGGAGRDKEQTSLTTGMARPALAASNRGETHAPARRVIVCGVIWASAE